MLLLTDIRRCPACGRTRTIRFDQRRCSSCLTRIFKPDDDWKKIKSDWILSGWVFFSPRSSGNFRGWVYQTHLDAPQPALDVSVKRPDASYNTVARAKGTSSEHTLQSLGSQQFSR